jgi:hypothetical protein
MSRWLTGFFSENDRTEHILSKVPPNVAQAYLDTTLDQNMKQATFAGLDGSDCIAGAYCPADKYSYEFSLQSYPVWQRVSHSYEHTDFGEMKSVKLPNQVLDMSAQFNGTQMEVLFLLDDGSIWRVNGAPWMKGFSDAWTGIPFITAPFVGGQRISVFQGAGAGHAIVSTRKEIFEMWYSPSGGGTVELVKSLVDIYDIGAFFTNDGVAHVVYATSLKVTETRFWELTYVPAQVPPSFRQLGDVNFQVDNLAAYPMPDGTRHVVFHRANDQGFGLFLAKYNDGSVLGAPIGIVP